MNRDVVDVIAGAASVALIVFATRWMSGRAAAEQPKHSPAGTIYRMRLRIRVVSYAAAALFVPIAVFAVRDGRRVAAALFGGFALLAIWFGTGELLTNAAGIRGFKRSDKQNGSRRCRTEHRIGKAGRRHAVRSA